MNLGVCYYPEHWPKSQWLEDASRMADLGISHVRMGEFAWSRFEPKPDHYQWDWMHETLDIMASKKLKVILGTPTATPPSWLLQKHPEILAKDDHNQVRKFGSRRHYCFSSPAYREYSDKIVTVMCQEFGQNETVVAWQTDNEYGCHDTIRSYSDAAHLGFQNWCQEKFTDISRLNEAWGNVFWSMEYTSFREIALPNQTTTEANPSHLLDFYRFSSDQVVKYNQSQVAILRKYSPGRELLHNYMGFFTSFDHYKVANDLDIATWDSYPLGFLIQFEKDPNLVNKYFNTGHPDTSAFHHDLYRGVGKGRMWVMEQQPGPVNWASHNAAPLPGMVKLWAWEAFAHGAELVSFFRWRQAPFAQEQFHAGLNLPNNDPADAFEEVRELYQEMQLLDEDSFNPPASSIAMVFDYESDWTLRIARQGASYDPLEWFMKIYGVLRTLGQNIDIIPATAELSPYALVVIPNLAIVSEAFVSKLKTYQGQVFVGPRTGSKTNSLCIPTRLPPAGLQDLIPITVSKVESLPPSKSIAVDLNSQSRIETWREWISSEIQPSHKSDDGVGFLYKKGKVTYLAACLNTHGLQSVLAPICEEAGIAIEKLAEGLRYQRRGKLCFAFNYGSEPVDLGIDQCIVGSRQLKQGQVAIWNDET